MNYEENKTEGQREVGPELEARIVAWVAGEASAFEAAELERLISERPELAIFKRRIAAVHGLVAEAVRPEKNPLRLSPERRAGLLQAIGAKETAAGTADAPPKRPSLWATRQWQTREYRKWLGIAACVAFGLLIFALSFPAFQQVRYAEDRGGRYLLHMDREGSFSAEEKRAEVSMLDRKKAMEDAAVARQERKEFRAARSDSRHSLTVNLPSQSPQAAPLLADEAPDADDAPGAEADQAPRLVDISGPAPNAAFMEVPVPAQPRLPAWGHSAVRSVAPMALDTVAGTRVRTDLKDVSSAISVVTQQFLQDTGAKNQQDVPAYTPSTEAAGRSGNSPAGNGAPALAGGKGWAERTGDFGQTEVAANTSAVFGIRQAQSVDSLQLGSGGPIDNKGLSYGGKSGEEVILSPFVIDAAKDQEYRASGTPADAQPNTSRTIGALRFDPALPKSEPNKEKTAPVARDDDQPAQPAARPAAPVAVTAEASAAQEPVSTFSLHVSDASFRLAQAALARGETPDPASIRPEEFYNAFDYGDPAPAASRRSPAGSSSRPIPCCSSATWCGSRCACRRRAAAPASRCA